MKIRSFVGDQSAVVESSDILANLGHVASAGILPMSAFDSLVKDMAWLLENPVGSVRVVDLGVAGTFSMERLDEATPLSPISAQEKTVAPSTLN